MIAIDKDQTLNVLTSPNKPHQSYEVLRLEEDYIFVGKHNCIHGGSGNKGLRFHAMFVPPGEASADESVTDFFYQ